MSFANLTDLEGKRILVTGANGHIGRRIVAWLWEYRAEVLATDHQETSADWKSPHHGVVGMPTWGIQYFQTDLADEKQVRGMAQIIANAGVDGIVHCAALTGQGAGIREGWVGPFNKQSVEAFMYSLQVQAISSMILMQELGEALTLSKKGSSVVIFGSIYGMVAPQKDQYISSPGVTSHGGITSPVGYSATKGAMLQLMRHYATEFAPAVRVNMVTPGGLERGQDEDFIKRYENKTPLRRMGKEEDMVGPTLFLLSDMSKYITGQNLVVDGGYTCQ